MNLTSVENCTCFNLRRVTRVITQSFDAELRKYGIRVTQTPILSALNARRGWSMEELSDWLGMERTTLVRNLRPLEREGFIKIEGGGRGSRVALSLTAKGKKELENVQPAWRSVQRTILKTLGEDRWGSILADLEKATSNLKS